MSFRIHSASPELKRELESKLTELEGQFDQGFEYEISAEMLPREQALDRVENLVNEIEAESVFVAEGVFAPEPPLEQEEDPDFAMGLPPVSDERAPEHGPVPQSPQAPGPAPVQEARPPRIDAQKIKDAAAARASQAGAVAKRAGERTGSALRVAGGHTARFLREAGEWASQRAGDAKIAGGEMLQRLAVKSEHWRASLAEWNAQREERRLIESAAREQRRRAAHREAELAAISAQLMLGRQKQEDKIVQAAELIRRKPELRPVLRPAKPAPEERDMWPVWRNAFVAAACIALVGVFLLASGGNQSSATPATSTELSRPAVVAPSHSAEQPKRQTTPPQAVAKLPQKISAARPSARKRVASPADEYEAFQEVTVRHYPHTSSLAPPKKNSKGVVQISDME